MWRCLKMSHKIERKNRQILTANPTKNGHFFKNPFPKRDMPFPLRFEASFFSADVRRTDGRTVQLSASRSCIRLVRCDFEAHFELFFLVWSTFINIARFARAEKMLFWHLSQSRKNVHILFPCVEIYFRGVLGAAK